jgi:hypothetical protein
VTRNGRWVFGRYPCAAFSQSVRMRGRAQTLGNSSMLALARACARYGPQKTPAVRDAVFRAVNKAAGAAYRAMVRPPTKMTIAKAARQVMEVAYMKASDGNTLPANARQIMYAARPDILRLAGVEKFSDNRFTQYNLPDFITANPELCVEWDVVFDARGHFREPDHREFGLGTLEVRNYVDDRPSLGPAVTFNVNPLYPTSGPKNRYRNVLFIEKEGFDTLLRQARIAERFDIAIMSTKGMSVTAARLLLDRLAPQIDRVFTLHDFDVTGFSISGTLGTDGRRYIYENAVEFIDLGLRLADAEAMDLQSEPVEVEGDRDARAKTLRGHGATEKEIAFLLGEDGQKARRVELNSMTSRQFIDFLDQKLTEHGVEKVVPDAEIIERHARRLVEQRLAKEEIDKIRDRLAKEAAARKLPSDLPGRVRKLLADRPELSWDMALALILQRPPGIVRVNPPAAPGGRLIAPCLRTWCGRVGPERVFAARARATPRPRPRPCGAASSTGSICSSTWPVPQRRQPVVGTVPRRRPRRSRTSESRRQAGHRSATGKLSGGNRRRTRAGRESEGDGRRRGRLANPLIEINPSGFGVSYTCGSLAHIYFP